MGLSLGLDLGSTRLKAGVLEKESLLTAFTAVDTPALQRNGLLAEWDPIAFLERATELLQTICSKVPAGTPLGIASQRSTCVIWERDSGRALTQIISWQDRSALPWCQDHHHLESTVTATTGLPLSPHYAGAKLAYLLEKNPALRREVLSGQCCFGTLEAFLIWHWTNGQELSSDLTMAARTLLADPQKKVWKPEILGIQNLPEVLLPRLRRPECDIPMLQGVVLKATLADQPSSARVAIQEGEALVNMGTGIFVLQHTGSSFTQVPGYLTGPISWDHYALEGTINSGGATAERMGQEATEFPSRDPDPDGFCLPDESGIGAPHWKADIPLTFSRAELQNPRRIFLEGLLFRIREILDDLFPDKPPKKIVVTGGLSRDAALMAALAATLEREVEVLDEPEATLLGAARLAAGLSPYALLPTEKVAPLPSYLPEKYHRWKQWFQEQLSSA